MKLVTQLSTNIIGERFILQRPRSRSFVLMTLCFVGVAHSTSVSARNEFAETDVISPCARVQSFEGEVQILDETRMRVKEVKYGEGISCGSWLSATAGWIRLKHRDGWSFSLAPGSFAQLLNPPSLGGDQLLLFKGSAYIRSTEGAPEARILTANSRVRVSEGAGTVTYIAETEETQWLNAKGRSSLENRFQDERPVQVAAGEVSSLNFRQMRVVPSEPMAVSSAQVKQKLEEFRLEEDEVKSAIAVVRTRQDRRIASVIGGPVVPVRSQSEGSPTLRESRTENRVVIQETASPSRSPASHSEGQEGKAKEVHPSSSEKSNQPKEAASLSVPETHGADYSRHPGVTPEQQEEVRSRVVRKVAGDGPVTEEMVSPDEDLSFKTLENGDRSVRSPSEFKVRAVRHSSGRIKKKAVSTDEEKKRILEELSKIGAE